jgi:5'-nucleotidase
MRVPPARPLALTLAAGGVILGAVTAALLAPTAPTALAAAQPTAAQPTAARPAAQPAAQPASTKTAHVQILAFNDFHGHLEAGDLSISAKTGTSHGKGYVKAGGAAYLAAKVKAAKKANPASVVVSAGDLWGASPMISGYYHDQSTVEAMNKILDVGVVGNHEFDEGTAELRRMVSGGCHPIDGCAGETSYSGTNFDLLAANVIERSTGRPMLPAYTIKDVGGAKIGFIGVVTTDTTHLVGADGIADVTFTDEAATVNALAPQVRAAGADAIVVLIHEGAAQSSGGINDCHGIAGPAVTFTEKVAGNVDAVLSAHTHKAYNCLVKGKRLTSAASYGRVLTTLKLTVDTTHHKVTKLSASNSVVDHKRTPVASVAKIVAHYHGLIAPIANKNVGTLKKTASRTPSRTGESKLGDLVADAQLTATKSAAHGGAQLAIVNRGVLRADLTKGSVSYGETYDSQPYGHRLVTMTLTGKQLDAALEDQFCDSFSTTNDRHVPLNVSAGFSYSYDPKKPCGQRIRMRDTKLHGTAISSAKTYRVTMNSYLAAGGDGITGMTKGTSTRVGILDRDALAGYLKAHKSLTPPSRTRVTLR